ncbi:hypothetical protein ES708_00582 [subsurface metagenome]
MPQSFKALSSTIAWVLFILGWIIVLAVIVDVVGLITGLLLVPNIDLLTLVAIFGAGIISFILSACAMKLRQTME